jgi:hypothetical protein
LLTLRFFLLHPLHLVVVGAGERSGGSAIDSLTSQCHTPPVSVNAIVL